MFIATLQDNSLICALMCVTLVLQSVRLREYTQVCLSVYAWFMRAINRPEMEVRNLRNDSESTFASLSDWKDPFLTFAQLLLRLGRYLLEFATILSHLCSQPSCATPSCYIQCGYHELYEHFTTYSNCLHEFTEVLHELYMNYTSSRWRTSLLYIKYSWTRARRDFRIFDLFKICAVCHTVTKELVENFFISLLVYVCSSRLGLW